MPYAVWWGCYIPHYIPEYESSTRAVCAALDIPLVDVEFACCGYPVRHKSFHAFLAQAAAGMALAEARGLDIMTPCKCCFGMLRQAGRFLADNPGLAATINRVLADQGVRYQGTARVYHLLQVLHADAGTAKIKEMVQNPLGDWKCAVSYGCHALRPSKVTQFEPGPRPMLFDELVEATGAVTVPWSHKTECCGYPLRRVNDDLSRQFGRAKFLSAKEAGATVMVDSCTFSHLQFVLVQHEEIYSQPELLEVRPILYPQLLGMALGMSADEVGWGKDEPVRQAVAAGTPPPVRPPTGASPAH